MPLNKKKKQTKTSVGVNLLICDIIFTKLSLAHGYLFMSYTVDDNLQSSYSAILKPNF